MGDGAPMALVAAPWFPRRTPAGPSRSMDSGVQAAARGWRELQIGRQGDPKLEPARTCRAPRATAVPHATAGLHPFDAAGGHGSGCAVRIQIAHAAFGDVGQGGDA